MPQMDINLVRSRHKELSSGKVHLVWLTSDLQVQCRSVGIVRLENIIHDPRKRVVDQRITSYKWDYKYCSPSPVAEVLFTGCRSIRIRRMENIIHDPKKVVVNPKSAST